MNYWSGTVNIGNVFSHITLKNGVDDFPDVAWFFFVFSVEETVGVFTINLSIRTFVSYSTKEATFYRQNNSAFLVYLQREYRRIKCRRC